MRQDGQRPDPHSGQYAHTQQLPQQRLLFPPGLLVPLLFRTQHPGTGRPDRCRLRRGCAVRRRLHGRRHHLDGAAAFAARTRGRSRRFEHLPAGRPENAPDQSHRPGTPHPLPAPLPRRNQAAARRPAGTQTGRTARSQVGRVDDGRSRDAGKERSRGDRGARKIVPHRLRHAHYGNEDVPSRHRRARNRRHDRRHFQSIRTGRSRSRRSCRSTAKRCSNLAQRRRTAKRPPAAVRRPEPRD